MADARGEAARLTFAERAGRGAIVALFVGGWVGAGIALRLGGNAYLLLGVPLTLAFQRYVARRPLASLWIRDAERFAPDRGAWAIALGFAIVPVVDGATFVRSGQVTGALWSLCAVVGALGVGITLRHRGRAAVIGLVRTALVAAAALGAVMLVAWVTGRRDLPFVHAAGVFARSFLNYVPIAFVLEEVTFRGALDAYVHPERAPRGLGSVLFVSALWGAWHSPIVASPLAQLVAFHSALGLLLTALWRRDRALQRAAFVHAALDAVRNGVLVLFALPFGQ